MNRLDHTLSQLKAKGEKALITYIMAGDPSLQETEQLVLELEQPSVVSKAGPRFGGFWNRCGIFGLRPGSLSS